MDDLLDLDQFGDDPFEVDSQVAHLFNHPTLDWKTSWTSGRTTRCSTRRNLQRTG
ncbi:hypothetical protein JQN72_04440 [Phycicoccus sp. CSK15P-2]|uniref:hypothetical protein n=1 Tax=Phycicoccus sp. CSK15P-2 TaxID=2807627 RepID=UPI00194DE8E3|nr:hypothetical protein [Phycicoccus sp. CSK15P-2]MBM6403490.1 hypothetical protein [Phycicoccus sp. CSK15P-2]